MWGGGQHGDGGNDGEHGEGDQTDAVQHHGRELPVVLDVGRLVLVPHLVADHTDLLQNVDKLPVDPRVGKALPEIVQGCRGSAK